MAVREMLRQLANTGFQVEICSATIFDHPRGAERLRGYPQWEAVKKKIGCSMIVKDDPLEHKLLITSDTAREKLTSSEEMVWFNTFTENIDRFQPDLILYYGGQVLDMLMTAEAKSRGIPVVAFLCNGNYSGQRWCRDVSLILTDSKATAKRYAQTDGLEVVPVGAFINPEPVLAPTHSQQHVLFVNPSLEKGAALVCQLAMFLEKRRPDINFEVVESRGNWRALVKLISTQKGEPRESLLNVQVTPNTADMRPVYGRARVLLALSLWWESFGRVAAEAVMNGVPVIHSGSGGLTEVVGDAGIRVELPAKFHKAPYNHLMPDESLQKIANAIERMYDDQNFYKNYVDSTAVQAKRHSLSANTRALITALSPIIKR